MVERRAAAIAWRPSAEQMRAVVQAAAPEGLKVHEAVDQGELFVVRGRGPTMTSVNDLVRTLGRLVRTSRRELAWEVDRFQGPEGVRSVLRGADGPLGDRDLWSLSWFIVEMSASEEVASGPATFELRAGVLQ